MNDEERRIDEQRKALGMEGMVKKDEELARACGENEVWRCKNLLHKFDLSLPSIDKYTFFHTQLHGSFPAIANSLLIWNVTNLIYSDTSADLITRV